MILCAKLCLSYKPQGATDCAIFVLTVCLNGHGLHFETWYTKSSYKMKELALGLKVRNGVPQVGGL